MSDPANFFARLPSAIEKEGTQSAQQAIDLLMVRIEFAKNAAIREGCTPNEGWLGPSQAGIAMVMMNRLVADGKLHSGNIDRVIRNDVEGAMIGGLTIRLSAGDGVRVGTTFHAA